MNNSLFDVHSPMTLERAIKIYDYVTPAIPKVGFGDAIKVQSVSELIKQFDVFFLDGFGVLNIGKFPVQGAQQFLKLAKQSDVKVFVVTNAGSKSNRAISDNFKNMGLSIPPSDIISSRMSLTQYLTDTRADLKKVGIVDSFAENISLNGKKGKRLSPLDPQDWLNVQSIAFLGAVNWNSTWQKCLSHWLANGNSLWVANPDVASPQGDKLSFEPGFWATAAAAASNSFDRIKWFGKPYPAIFELAIEKVKNNFSDKMLDLNRCAMIGDTLHTDILGAQNLGIKTILFDEFGLLKGYDSECIIKNTGIYPDFVAKGF